MDHYAELVGKYPTTNKEYLPAAINDTGLFWNIKVIKVFMIKVIKMFFIIKGSVF